MLPQSRGNESTVPLAWCDWHIEGFVGKATGDTSAVLMGRSYDEPSEWIDHLVYFIEVGPDTILFVHGNTIFTSVGWLRMVLRGRISCWTYHLLHSDRYRY